MIAALCVGSNSEYKNIPGVDCYDHKRNARSYCGTDPVVCHPPCRGYSAFFKHMAKPSPGEKDLALFCAEQVARNGGVIEHPAHSHFIKMFIGNKDWKIETVHQSWFGYFIRKKTWLLMPAHYKLPEIPFNLHPGWYPGEQRKLFDTSSKDQRSHTTKAFAEWLVQLVRINALQAQD